MARGQSTARGVVADAVSLALRANSIPAGVLPLMLSQIWLETDRGRSMWQNNVGNISANEKSWTGPVWRPGWYELTPESTPRQRRLHADMLVGNAPSAFRAYPTLQAGATDYVRRLKFNFASVLAAMKTGNIDRTARAIRESRYCPDCKQEETTKALRSLREYWRPWLQEHGYQTSTQSGGVMRGLVFYGSAAAVLWLWINKD